VLRVVDNYLRSGQRFVYLMVTLPEPVAQNTPVVR